MKTTAQVRRGPVTGSGIYLLDAETYHADPCPAPSLNHTIARVLTDQTPMHAYRAHPRLGGEHTPATRDMVLGSVVHALALGRGRDIIPVPYDSYRKKDAQELRDEALAAGKIPILADDLARAREMAQPAADAISDTLGLNVKDCLVEHTFVVNVDGVWFRSMMDAVRPDLRAAADLKTTANANPDMFARIVQRYGATSDAFYTRILHTLAGGERPRFYFVAQERDTPEAITIHRADDGLLTMADEQMRRASTLWVECSRSNKWPGYDRGVRMVPTPAWQVAEMEIPEDD